MAQTSEELKSTPRDANDIRRLRYFRGQLVMISVNEIKKYD